MNAQEAAKVAVQAAEMINEVIAESDNSEAVALIESLKTAIERFTTDEDKAVSFYRSILSTVNGEDVIAALDHFVPSQGFETVSQFTARLDVLKECVAKADKAEQDKEAERAAKEAVAASITSAKGQILKLLKDAPGTPNKKILVCLPVDIFCNVSRYVNNRDVVKRALKYSRAEKKEALLDCQRDDDVSLILLDPVKNKEIWDKTEKAAKEAGLPSTLPLIVGDSNTRSYGWSTLRNGKPLMSHPVSGFVTASVFSGWTNEEIEKFVSRKCAGDNKETNVEKQERILKSADIWEACTSDFIKKDSWKTAFRTIDPSLAKDLDKTFVDYQDEILAINSLQLETKKIATHKKLSGVRAAMISTFKTTNRGKWKEFWSKFFNPKCKTEAITDLWATLEEDTTRPARDTMKLCVDLFNEQVK